MNEHNVDVLQVEHNVEVLQVDKLDRFCCFTERRTYGVEGCSLARTSD